MFSYCFFFFIYFYNSFILKKTNFKFEANKIKESWKISLHLFFFFRFHGYNKESSFAQPAKCLFWLLLFFFKIFVSSSFMNKCAMYISYTYTKFFIVCETKNHIQKKICIQFLCTFAWLCWLYCKKMSDVRCHFILK